MKVDKLKYKKFTHRSRENGKLNVFDKKKKKKKR